MEYRPCSLRLDAGELDHLGPLLGFFDDELPKFSGRADNRCASQVGKPRLHLGITESRVDLLVELLDDLGRRSLWCADAEPITRLVVEHELTHGPDVRQRVRSRRGGYCERAQPASPDIPYRSDSGGEHDLHLPRDEII